VAEPALENITQQQYEDLPYLENICRYTTKSFLQKSKTRRLYCQEAATGGGSPGTT
jgi:hypothetical protein